MTDSDADHHDYHDGCRQLRLACGGPAGRGPNRGAVNKYRARTRYTGCKARGPTGAARRPHWHLTRDLPEVAISWHWHDCSGLRPPFESRFRVPGPPRPRGRRRQLELHHRTTTGKSLTVNGAVKTATAITIGPSTGISSHDWNAPSRCRDSDRDAGPPGRVYRS